MMKEECPFEKGCPFKDCKTKEEILSKMKELEEDPVWGPFLMKMKKCPLFQKCPYNEIQSILNE